MTVNPWDALEAEEAEKAPEPLYTSIGHALSVWESMEQHLSYFFGFFCTGVGDGDRSIPSKRAYGSVITFRGRADMLRSAAEAYFMPHPDHAMKDRFFELLNMACNLSPRRNEIAHGCVTNVWFQFDEGKDIQIASLDESLKAMRWLHCPPEYATNKHTPAVMDGMKYRKRKYAYSTREIDHYRKQFELLRRGYWTLVIDWADKYPEADILPPI